MKGKCKVFSPLFGKQRGFAISSCPSFFRSPVEKSPRCVLEPSEIVKLLLPFLCVSTRRRDGGRKIDFIGCSAPPGREITSVFLWKRKRLTAPRRPYISFESTRYTLDKYWRCLYPRLTTAKHPIHTHTHTPFFTNENFLENFAPISSTKPNFFLKKGGKKSNVEKRSKVRREWFFQRSNIENKITWINRRSRR